MFTKSRDRNVGFQQEFAAFIRALRLLVQPTSDVSAAFEKTELLSVRNFELCALDDENFRALFEQYFDFDINSQQPFFYREVQQFLSCLFTALVTVYQLDVDALCLMPFVPTLVFSGSKDRLVVSLFLTSLVLTRHRLLANDCGSTVLLQSSEV